MDLTEGRSTGIPKIPRVMAANVSPTPVFETDEDRSQFLIRLPVHVGIAGVAQATEQVAHQVAHQVTHQVKALLLACAGEMNRTDLMRALAER